MDIKNLSEVVVLGCKGFQAYEDSRKDGKIDATDILFLIPVAQALQPAIQDINLIPAEALDLDAREMDELIVLVQKEIPSLGAKLDVLRKVKAVMSLLLAAKDAYNAFAAKPIGNQPAAFAANSFEGESEGLARAAARADDMPAQMNLAAAEAKRAEIAAARQPKAAAEEVKAAEAVVAAAEVTPQIPSA